MSDAAAPIIGLNIRKEANGKSTRIGLLPRGARITVKNRGEKWAQIDRILEGQIAPVRPGEAVDPAAAQGWVFLSELDPGPKAPLTLDQVVIPEKPIPVSAGALLGHVGEYQQYVDAQPRAKRGWRQMVHIETFAGNDLPVFVKTARKYASLLPPNTGSMFLIDKGAKLKLPVAHDTTWPADTRLVQGKDGAIGPWAKIQKAGLVVMDREALGAYSSKSKRYAKAPDAEWTGWFVGPADTDRTLDEKLAKKLNYKRREMRMPQGDAVWVERASLVSCGADGMKVWKKFPLRLDGPDAGGEAAFARVMTRAELEKNPPADRVVDADGKPWWRVSVRSQNAGKIHVGWVCESGMPKVGWQSPWAWPGFDWVEEGQIQPVDMLSASLVNMGALRADEVTDYKMRADKVDKSALVKKLYEQLDTDKSGYLSKAELRTAMEQPLMAQAMSRMIARYESEWGGSDAKWDALDPLMLGGQPEWSAEKLRIKHLRWWDRVQPKVPGFPVSPEVYHIHPIALLNNFYSPLGEANAAATDGGATSKSGKHWHGRFLQSAKVADLKSPFREGASSFIAAMKAGGIDVIINTTLRPPQRSYLMYYAREVVQGLAPGKVPKFVPQNGDEPVNIDWEHLDANGKPDLDAAKKGARAMDQAYAAAGAIGKPYSSNHNGGEAIDMKFDPPWGIGKTVKNASGVSVAITSKRDLQEVGATYKVYHWTYHGPKNKVDEPHWSKTGN